MASKLDVGNLLIAIVSGVARGSVVSLVAVAAGLSPKLAGPITGGIVGPVIAVNYRMRTRQPAKSDAVTGS